MRLVVGTALINKRFIRIDDFLDESNLRDKRITDLARKVRLRLDQSLDRFHPDPPEGEGFRTAIVEVYFKSGTRVAERVGYPKSR